jgi:predicted permease
MTGLWLRIRRLFKSSEYEREIDDELRFHIDMETEKNIRSGMSPREARRAAMIAFGGVDRHTEATREARGTALLESILKDFAYAARGLARQRGFTIVAVLALGAGVGAAGGVFAILNQLLLRPPAGVADPAGATILRFEGPDPRLAQTGWPMYAPDVDWLRGSASLLDGLASTETMWVRASLDGMHPIEVRGTTIYGDYFEVLGVIPSEGRLLTAAETDSGADPSLVVISERLKSSLFGEAENVVGRRFVITGFGETLDATVVGVAGGGFRGHDRFWEFDLWMPRSAEAALGSYPQERLHSRTGAGMQFFIARPAAGVTMVAAETQLDQLLARLAGIYPDLQGVGARITGSLLDPAYVTFLRASLVGLFIGAALVILIPCANVANLLLMREAARRREIAVRRAIGATTARLVRLRLIEGSLISVFGTAVGIGAALLVVTTIRGETVLGMPLVGFEPDLRIGAFFVIALSLTALLIGLAPPFLAGRRDAAGDLRGASAQITQGRRGVRLAFSAIQVGLSMTLLVGAALIGRSVRELYLVDTGLEFDGVSEVSIDLTSDAREPGQSREARDAASARRIEALQSELADAMRSVPGATHVAFADVGPFADLQLGTGIAAPGVSDDDAERVIATWTGPGWFELFGVTAIQGRIFQAEDARASAPLRAVVTASLADRLFAGTDAVGQTVRVGVRFLEDAEIVGIVGDLQVADLRSQSTEAVFFARPPSHLRQSLTVLLRTDGSSPGLPDEVHDAVRRVVPSLLVHAPERVADRLDVQFSEQRVLTISFALLSLITLVIASVGLYAVVAFGVAEQTREFAIRRALGADGRRIIALVTRSSALIVGLGAAIGLFGGYALSRVVESRLFGVGPLDAASYGIAVTIVFAVGALATWFPARVAARGESMAALNNE